MKITRKLIRKIIQEQMATVNKDTIEDIVMGILSDEGGAAGLEPIEDALEDLEDDDISLPDEPIEDIVNDVTGVKRHADGDYIDTTKLEGRLRITRRQLQKVLRESLFAEGKMGERYAEIEGAVDIALNDSPGLAGAAVAAAVMEELSDYGMADPRLKITQEEIFDVLDVMMDEGQVFFDIENDMWYMADSPQGKAAIQAMVDRA